MSFKDKEKKRLVKIKPALFSLGAQQKGLYGKNRYDYCIHEYCADENLYQSIRNDAIKYFIDRRIDWHGGTKQNPSTNLCCSQSTCVNFLYPYRFEPVLLKNILIEIGYPVKEVLPFYADKINEDQDPYVAFEWIGTRNYLRELLRGEVAGDNQRSRGKGFTSADFAILFRRTDDKIQLLLGEWKYTEEYRSKGSIQFSKAKTNRLDKIYLPFLQNNSPINIVPHKEFSILFFEPFDQLMRLQLLAKQMELSSSKELNADIVTVLHIAPKANKELIDYIPNYGLKHFGSNIHEVWNKIAEPRKFKGFDTEDLIKIVTNPTNAADKNWADYITLRYGF